MGWTVHDVKASSVWEFFSAFNGYLDANTPKQSGKLPEDDKELIWAEIQKRMAQLDRSSATLSTQTYTIDGRQLVPAGVVTFRPNGSS